MEMKSHVDVDVEIAVDVAVDVDVAILSVKNVVVQVLPLI